MAVQRALLQPAFLRDFRERDRSISQRVVNRFQSFGIELADGALRYYHAVILPLSRAVRVAAGERHALLLNTLYFPDRASCSPSLCVRALPVSVAPRGPHVAGISSSSR